MRARHRDILSGIPSPSRGLPPAAPEPVARVASAASRLTPALQILAALGLSALVFVFAGWLAVRVAVSGPRDEVPDLTGLEPVAARQRLESLGMTAQVDEERLPREDLPAGRVARQIPGPGTPLKRVRVVRLMLASGPRQRELPDMAGESRSRAIIALQQQEFEVDYEATAPSWEVPGGRIIGQEPQPEELEPGRAAPLRLLTSLGAPPRDYVMVDLGGRPAEQIRPWLESLGFRVTEGANRRVLADVPPGTIVGQQPFAGHKIAEGSEIVLQVSR